MLPPFLIILGFFTAYSMNFFSSQYCTFQCLHFCLVSIITARCWSECPSISVWSTVLKCSEAFASKGAHLCSELSKACMISPGQQGLRGAAKWLGITLNTDRPHICICREGRYMCISQVLGARCQLRVKTKRENCHRSWWHATEKSQPC